MKSTVIRMKTVYPAFISSRKSIALLQKAFSFNQKGKYVFDFDGIDFISRSFADEFLKFVSDKNISYDFEKMNSTINELFEAVKKTQNPTQRYFEEITITSFKQGSSLHNLLATF